jgi:ComF family protein
MRVVERILNFVAPHDCLACGAEGGLLCAACYIMVPPDQPRCYLCGAYDAQSRVCRPCRQKTPLRRVAVATPYAGLAQDVIYKLKFGRTRSAAESIAAVMAARLPALPQNMMVCFAPTAPSRVRRRGFDQAALIARHLARLTDREYVSLLARTTATRQLGANKVTRKQQMEGAFRVPDTVRVRGATILLVDDILTTGATLESAAFALKAAGAKRIEAAVFARVL